MIGVARRRCMGAKHEGEYPIPSGAVQIEYLETGSSNIGLMNTGITPDATTVLRIKFVNLAVTGDVIVGYKGNDITDWRLFNARGTMYFDTYNHERISGGTLAVNTLYELELGNYYVKDIPTNTKLLLGSTYSGSGIRDITLWGKSSSKTSFNRIYYCQIYQGGQLVRDFVPIRVGTTGYMFDKINGVSYANRNEADFILGPDV